MAEEGKKQKRSSFKKRELQDAKKRVQRKAYRSKVKTAAKGFIASVKNQEKEAAMKAFQTLSSLVDKGVHKGIFKKNKACRIKARMSQKMAAI